MRGGGRVFTCTCRRELVAVKGTRGRREMSKETLEWLRGNVRVGFTGENGPAWWANSGEYMADGTHFEGPVPAGEVRRVLSIPIREGSVETTYVNEDGETVTRRDPHRKAMVNGRNGDILGVFKE